MAISVTSYEKNEHSVLLNIGTQELRLRHLSDVQINALNLATPSSENAQDTTGEPVSIGL